MGMEDEVLRVWPPCLARPALEKAARTEGA